MKRFFAICLSLLLTISTVYAAPSSMPVQPTDIKVFLHGKEIPSCAVNNSMYIAADDLDQYGYSVTYIDSVRTLFVNKAGSPSDIMSEPCKVNKTLPTDIKVILNGEPVDRINSKFAANGKMYINANEISRYRDSFNNADPGEEGYPHLLTAVWNADSRTLLIDDSPLKSKEEQISRFLSYGGSREEYSTFLSFTENYFRGDDFDIVSLRIGGLPHGSTTRWHYFGDDGRSYSINTVCSPFKIHDSWGNCTIKNPSIEGRRFYFEGQRTMSMIDSSEGVYYGTYYLDLDTTVVHAVEETRSN